MVAMDHPSAKGRSGGGRCTSSSTAPRGNCARNPLGSSFANACSSGASSDPYECSGKIVRHSVVFPICRGPVSTDASERTVEHQGLRFRRTIEPSPSRMNAARCWVRREQWNPTRLAGKAVAALAKLPKLWPQLRTQCTVGFVARSILVPLLPSNAQIPIAPLEPLIVLPTNFPSMDIVTEGSSQSGMMSDARLVNPLAKLIGASPGRQGWLPLSTMMPALWEMEKRMEGKLTVESKKGPGRVFTIHLPLAA